MRGMQIRALQPYLVFLLIQFVVSGFHPRLLCVLHRQRSFFSYRFKGFLPRRQVGNLEILYSLVCSWNVSHPDLIQCFLCGVGRATIDDVLYHRKPFRPIVCLVIAEDS